jgi:hypothetical protein
VAAALPAPRVAAQEDDAPGFAVAPYLLAVTTDAATVAFHLRQPLPAEVLVYTGAGRRRFSSPAARSHFVRVTGLPAGRTCRYEVICGGGQVRTPPADASYQIRTAGRPGESFSFTVYGDARPGDTRSHRSHREVVRQMLQVEPAFSLVLGDMVDDGSQPAQWERFFQIESRLRRRSAIFPVPGDNDHAGGRGLWRRYFPQPGAPPYRFRWGGVQLIGMNTWGTLGAQPPRELDQRSPQLRWLRHELERPEVRRAAFRVLFLHDPVFISRGRSAEVLRRHWAPLLARGGVDLVFASWHLYERSRHDGVTHIITGGAGAELVWLPPNPGFPSQAEARRHHFCRVDVKAGAMRVRAVAVDGTVLDSVTLLPRAARAAASPARVEPDAWSLRLTQFESLRLHGVLLTGALDGVSPCVLLTLTLLLCWLGLAGPARQRWPALAAAGLGLLVLVILAPPLRSPVVLEPLAAMLQDPHYRPAAALLLAIYCLGFLAPLVLTVPWIRRPARRVARCAAGLGGLLIAMAVLIIYNLWWP